MFDSTFGKIESILPDVTCWNW